VAVDLTPNAGMQTAAQRGLRLYDAGKGGDGLRPQTIRDAHLMADRKPLSDTKVRRMVAWFARHESDRKPGWDDKGKETPGFVAWLLWGGDAGRRWATAKVKQMNTEEASNVGRGKPAAHDSRSIISGGDRLLADALVDGVEDYGRFDAVSAGYEDPDQHAAAYAEGRACENCIFYRGQAGTDGCVIVAADVQPAGGCRLGIYGDLPSPVEDEAPDDGTMAPVMGAGDDSGGEDETSLADALEDVDEALDLGSSDDDDDEDGGDDDDAGVTVNVNIDFDAYSHNADNGSATAVDPLRSIERHTSRRAGVLWRESGAGSTLRTLTGYASVFNEPSDDLGGFREIIAPGAFKDALAAGADVRLLWNHDPNTIMARTTNGSLELREDDTGLAIWARVDMSDPDVSRLVGKVRSGLVDQMSFAFSVAQDGDEWGVIDGYPLRTVRNVSGLYDVSAVTYPAYSSGTKVDVMERAMQSGKIAHAAPVINPADSTSPRDNTGVALDRLRAKARSRVAVITFNLTR